MSFAQGGFLTKKHWPYGIDDLELIDGIYQIRQKPEVNFKIDSRALDEALKNISDAINTAKDKIPYLLNS